MKKKILATTAVLSIGFTTFGGVTSTFAAEQSKVVKSSAYASDYKIEILESTYDYTEPSITLQDGVLEFSYFGHPMMGPDGNSPTLVVKDRTGKIIENKSGNGYVVTTTKLGEGYTYEFHAKYTHWNVGVSEANVKVKL